MDAQEIAASLEEERSLLWEFLKLSEQQLSLLESEDIRGLDRLLEKRSRMTGQLEAIEATLGVWISDIQSNPHVSTELLQTLQSTNEEVVALANQILEIDERTRHRMDGSRTGTAYRSYGPHPGGPGVGMHPHAGDGPEGLQGVV